MTAQESVSVEAPVVPGTYSENECAERLGVHRTSVRRLAIQEPTHQVAKACLWITPNKRVYSRAVIEAYVAGEGVSK